MAFFTASYQQLLWSPNSIGVPEGPFGRVWLSLPHLVYNSVRSLTVWLLFWLSYIIVQRPFSRLLDLWNSMFDHHQAEITVMQFTGHSLPVHQSMSVPWEFFYLVPFHQPISAHTISSHNCRCITLEWHFWPCRRPKYNTLSSRTLDWGWNVYNWISVCWRRNTIETTWHSCRVAEIDNFFSSGGPLPRFELITGLSLLLDAIGAQFVEGWWGLEFLPLSRMSSDPSEATIIKRPRVIFWHGVMSNKYHIGWGFINSVMFFFTILNATIVIFASNHARNDNNLNMKNSHKIYPNSINT